MSTPRPLGLSGTTMATASVRASFWQRQRAQHVALRLVLMTCVLLTKSGTMTMPVDFCTTSNCRSCMPPATASATRVRRVTFHSGSTGAAGTSTVAGEPPTALLPMVATRLTLP